MTPEEYGQRLENQRARIDALEEMVEALGEKLEASELQIHDAKEIIHDLLKYGGHEGPCDNTDSGDACSFHKKALWGRAKKAEEFLKSTEKRFCDRCGQQAHSERGCACMYCGSAVGHMNCPKEPLNRAEEPGKEGRCPGCGMGWKSCECPDRARQA
jgi:NADH pyrophosphatase NudC (nudix superfamily)